MADEYKNFSDLLGNLNDARKEYEAAKKRTNAAQHQETAALNHLNGLQKKFDEVATAMRREAPTGTDWARQRIVPQPAGI